MHNTPTLYYLLKKSPNLKPHNPTLTTVIPTPTPHPTINPFYHTHAPMYSLAMYSLAMYSLAMYSLASYTIFVPPIVDLPASQGKRKTMLACGSLVGGNREIEVKLSVDRKWSSGL
ncbi:MAG: olfactory receptor OR11G-like [Candidatus Bathyarchaeota archaeon]|nr:olfactory receptor OR11G-like [Candidatus Termitimicrobium sp.]